ncbi:ATP-binding cassette domain-containing protein [Snodgrassella alvi]|uniref:ATP-binding cassette domain-containing protein n=1 Tax=Snodgrassella alvi TaxID=1196083 RepID=UPI0027412E63|nr:ABC transporter ATP-binding protein [Snodgrassella alvi]WLT02292.1 ABC transporter ATP-binding protein [Snodgrassella alvi]
MTDLNLSGKSIPPGLAHQWRVALPGLISGTLAAVIAGIAMLAGLWFIIKFIDNMSWRWLNYALVSWLLAALFTALSSWLAHQAESRFAAALRRTVAQHLIRLPSNILAKQNEQTLKQLLTDDVASLHHMLAHLPGEIAVFTVIPLLSIGILIYFIGISAIWVLLPGLIASVYYLIIIPRMTRRDGTARMQVMLDIINKADEYVRGIPVYRIYGQHSSALTAYTEATEKFTRNMVHWVAKAATPAAIATAMLQAVATFAIGYWVSYTQDTTTLAATLLFSLAIVTPALRLGHGIDYIRAGRAAAKRLTEFLHQPLLPAGTINHLPEPAVLSMHDAVFSQEEQLVLRKLSFTFPAGAITAITGPSGAGKTTLLNALAGYIPLTSGTVQLGKTDLSALHDDTRHRLILFIPQGYDVLDNTIRANLALTAPDASDEVMQQALARANLNLDLSTPARTLSGGEKQRICIARAFLTQAEIILMDEPTSALDDQNAREIFQALQELAHTAYKTIIIVTHQPALADKADAKLVLEALRSEA